MSQQSSMEIYNDRTVPHIVWIEPWGEDYTMLVKDKLRIATTSADTSDAPWFSLVETNGNTQVYVERGDYPQVFINDSVVRCGHNRQVAIDLGIFPD
jgi:hypothetical protein